MKTLRIISFAILFGLNAIGQEVKIPITYQFNTIEDYAPYKDSVVIASNWLIDNPLNQNRGTRELANKFIFRWVSGAPYTHIEIRPEFTNDVISDKSTIYAMDLLMNYIAGMTLVKIDNNDTDDLIVQEAGIKAMLKGYESVRNEVKIKFLEKALKLEKKSELSQWIQENAKIYDPKDKTKIIPKD
jgi:hypothetical protein